MSSYFSRDTIAIEIRISRLAETKRFSSTKFNELYVHVENRGGVGPLSGRVRQAVISFFTLYPIEI